MNREQKIAELLELLNSRPNIKRDLLEEFFNRIKSWVDYLQQRRKTITSS